MHYKINKKKINSFFISNGYQIINLFSKSDIKLLSNDIIDRILKLGKIKINKKNKFSLSKYHKTKNILLNHEKIVHGKTRYLKLRKRFCKKIYHNQIIRKILLTNWGHEKFKIKWIFDRRTKTKLNASGFRIARPVKNSKKDVGGFHLDLHYGGEKNNNQKALMTVWCPIVGLSEKYTLRISPKSHKLKHKQKFVSKQKKFLSPVFIKNYTKKFKFIRPKLKLGQAIIFHPNLVHGGSLNLGNQSRISIDFRLFNSKLF